MVQLLQSKPKIILFLSLPGAGKGTQSAFLVEKYNFQYISIGSILREKAKSDKSIAQIQKEGKLVSDDRIRQLLKDELMKIGRAQNVLIDGYPRNNQQLKYLLEIQKELQLPEFLLIYLKADPKILLKRLEKRLICPKCKNIPDSNSKSYREKLCQKCKVRLIKRLDDDPKIVRKRISEDLIRQKPILKYFAAKNQLVYINGNQSITATSNELIKKLNDYNQKSE